MYFKNIKLINTGPIKEVNYNFPFHDDGKPKPLILVGRNGAGKSIFLSHLLNPLLIAQSLAFEDAEIEKGKVFKLRSPIYIKNGETFSYARTNFGPDFSCYEWQLASPRKSFIDPAVDSSFQEIPAHETSLFNLTYEKNLPEITKQFKSNCILYFPANRFEQPAWLNERNLKATAKFMDLPNISEVSNRHIIQESPLFVSKNWMLDIVLDILKSDLKTDIIDAFEPTTNITTPISRFIGYDGSSTKLWNILTDLIKLIFGTDQNIHFGIGPRQNRIISVMKDDESVIPNIFQLSTGQTSVLNIVLSILRDFDSSGAVFENIEDIRGVVIIDEVDAHLHADLQCNLLPKIISMFPKIQFILTTHSPLFLLGMKDCFGDDGFEVLSLPSGEKIDIEEFEEFKSAFEFYKESNTFRQKIEFEVNQSQKPVIFVEGDYDIKYLKKAASLLGKEDILSQINLYDGDGFGNLDKIWSSCKDNKLSIAFPKIVGLIYDCDTNKTPSHRHMAKKQVIPSIPNNPISKGIENLFSEVTINRLRQSHLCFFDVTPSFSKMLGGVEEIQREICEINKSRKRNMCDFLCDNGDAQDFDHFKTVFDLIEDIIRVG